MPQGKQRRRTGEPQKVRQPFKLDKLPQEVREAVLRAHNKEGKNWEETAAIASKVAGQPISDEACRRWHDVRVLQENRESLERNKHAEQALAIFKGKDFEGVAESSMHALKAQVFGVMGAKTQKEKEESIGNFLFLLSKIMTARAAQQRAEIDERKLELAEKKFEDVKAKADKATSEAAEKLGKGKDLTIADINAIRRKVFGLGPAPGAAA